jgi:hypothetical protein
MELFLPSLIILVLVALFSFFVVPRMGATILVVVSIFALIAAGVHHYAMFSSEYALSTWQLGLQANAAWVVLGFALVFVLAALFYMFGSPGQAAAAATPLKSLQAAAEASVAAMPTAASATNAVTAALNRGLNAIAPGPGQGPQTPPQQPPQQQQRPANQFGVPLSQI